MNRFKVSKFRHMEARPSRREAWISDIRAGTTPTCGNHIKSSCSLIAFNSDRPGVLGIISLEGREENKRHVTYLGCHSDLITDLDFSPFDDFLLASGSADRTIKLWRLSGTGDALPSVPGVVLGPEELPVEVLQFHPTADGVLVSASGRTVKVWDVAKQQPLTELEAHKDLVQSAVWSRDGAIVGTACKDKQLRIFDPRARTQASQSTQAHENNRDIRLAWTGIQEHLVSTGFNQMREREVKLWDTRLFSSALASVTLDTSPGHLLVTQGPFVLELGPPFPHVGPQQQGETEAKGGSRALENSSLQAIVCCLEISVMTLGTVWAVLEGNLVKAEADHWWEAAEDSLTSGWVSWNLLRRPG